MKALITYITVLAGLLFSSGCAHDAAQPGPDGDDRIDVSVSFTGSDLWMTRAFPETHNIDRVLLIPFIKIDPSGPDTVDNFEAELAFAKQIEVENFPTPASLHLQRGATYMVLAFGYNQALLDYDTQGLVGNGFGFGFVSPALAPLKLTEMILGLDEEAQSMYPFSVPEIFTCYCADSSEAEVFEPSDNLGLSGRLVRMHGGLSVEVTNIPATVTSITIGTNVLGLSMRVYDQVAILSSALQEGGYPIDDRIPESGSATIETLLYPTQPTVPMDLYLDITTAAGTERHEVKLKDETGAIPDNSFHITPNNVVYVTGDYDDIGGEGFSISIADGIDLDDDEWDGLE